VERDATGIWWYGGIRRPMVPRSLLEDDTLGQALAARERMGQSVRLLDLTHDLEIPVIAAIIADKKGNLLALGFGCDVDKVSCRSPLPNDGSNKAVTRQGRKIADCWTGWPRPATCHICSRTNGLSRAARRMLPVVTSKLRT
jgi:hypothetical protein